MWFIWTIFGSKESEEEENDRTMVRLRTVGGDVVVVDNKCIKSGVDALSCEEEDTRDTKW